MRTFLFLLVFAAAAAAQTLEFEAASIKRNTSNRGPYERARFKAVTLMATNAPVEDLIRTAYGFEVRDIIGPSWIKGESFERYDVTAKAAGGSSPQDQRAMLQHMLASRFGLKVHPEKRELPVYLLQLNDGGLGPGLKRAVKNCLPTPSCEGRMGGGFSSLKGAEWSLIFREIARGAADRRVLDRTGLSGTFDFELTYSTTLLSATDGPAADIFAAVREQLGLKLESGRAPFEVLVVDSVSRPTPD